MCSWRSSAAIAAATLGLFITEPRPTGTSNVTGSVALGASLHFPVNAPRSSIVPPPRIAPSLADGSALAIELIYAMTLPSPLIVREAKLN